ncbi:ABC transporter substrate-binding protein, partial [bacterium]|nr:ABC transporter substrate-binding protein [bacterium]
SKLQRIVYKDLPAIPLFYSAHWYAFNDTKWVGWPREENPWWYPAAPWSGNNFPILFGIAKKGETPKVPTWLATKDKGGYLIPTSQIWNDFMRAK